MGPTAVEKRSNLAIITLAEILALSLWFSGTAAGPGLIAEADAPIASFQAWLTSAVQAGFVAGTLVSAALALPDRFDPRRVFSLACLLGATANAIILILPPGGLGDVLCRAATGVALAGIYPVGMKLAAGWATRNDTGLVVGLLVGGLTLGSALPHAVNALGGLAWRPTIAAASIGALVAAGIIGRAALGPLHTPAPRFRPAQAILLLRDRGTRLATLGYLGHMWELYAVWAWIGAYISASFASASNGDPTPTIASIATFAVVAVGAVGSVAAGLLADRIGRIRVTCAAMLVSAACCLLAGPLFGASPATTVALGLIWGVAVVADSAQFSACIAELAPPGLTGTLLTVQVCLGFTLTLVAIQLMPWFIGVSGWGGAFTILAVGPLLGVWAMLTLRRTPDAAKLAGGRG